MGAPAEEPATYPEHAKLRAISVTSQAIGQFMDWLQSTGRTVCDFDRSVNYDNYTPTRKSIQKLLAEYFEIDLRALDAEKEAMLEELRRINGVSP